MSILGCVENNAARVRSFRSSLRVTPVTEPMPGGALVFHAAPQPGDAEVGRVVVTVHQRGLRLLACRGYGTDAETAQDSLLAESPVLAGITNVSVARSPRRRAGLAARLGAGRALDWLDGLAPSPQRIGLVRPAPFGSFGRRGTSENAFYAA